jgi:8-oxo-dGTP pyrophosphatase MutT (NUDIX family)
MSAPTGKRLLTLAFVFREGKAQDQAGGVSGREVLLGEKLRGWRTGIWNGFGGKVESTDVSVLAAMQRELDEEAAITAVSPRRFAVLTFTFGREWAVLGLRVCGCRQMSMRLRREQFSVAFWFPLSNS